MKCGFSVTQWKPTLAASWLAQLCSIAGFALVVPFLPYYVRELGVTDEKSVLLWAGWLSSGAGLMMALVAPLWGVLADRHGRKLMVMRSMFGGMVVLALMAFVHNVHQLLALRILQGALTGTVSASVALVASIVPARRTGFSLGLMQAALFVGNAFGPAIGGPLADTVGYRIPFLVSAGLLLIGGLLTLFFVHEGFDPDEIKLNGKGTTTIRDVLGITGFTTMIGVLFMVQFSGSFIGPLLPVYIEKISGIPHPGALTGHIFLLGACAGGLAALLLGVLGDRLGHGTILVSCTFLDGLTLIPQGIVQTINQLIACRIAFSFCDGGTMPAANAFIRRLVPRHACGKAFGLTQSVSSFGWGLGPIVGSALAARFGMRFPFFLVGGIFFAISVVVSIVVPRMLRRIAASEAEALAPCCELVAEEALEQQMNTEGRPG